MDIESLENLNDLTQIVKCDQEEKILGWALGLVQVLVSGVDFEIHMKFVGVIWALGTKILTQVPSLYANYVCVLYNKLYIYNDVINKKIINTFLRAHLCAGVSFQ